MKARFIVMTTLIATVFLSCKDEKSDSENAVADRKAEENIVITISAIVEKDDIFQIFYNEIGTENFDGDQLVSVNVTGKTEPQNIEFKLPEDASPMNLRFDIGGNKELGKVTFKGLEIKKADKSLKVDQRDFFKYFYPNTNVEVDTVNTAAIMKIPSDGNYDPILGATQLMQAEIQKF